MYTKNKNLNAQVPASFTCEIVGDDGASDSVTIDIKINRFSFKDATRKEFTEALKNVEQEPEIIGELLVKLVAEWDVFDDPDCTQRTPITVENIIGQPVDFVTNMATAVVEKLYPNPQKAGTSASGSEPAEKSTSAATTSSEDGTSQELAVSGA